jgi:Rieske Fe-S protein
LISERGWSRRRLLQGAGGAIASALLVGYRSLADRLGAISPRARRVVVPPDATADVLFFEDAIVCRTPGGVSAFSTRCPHLGCRINRQVDHLLVCPCHGSRFHLDGTVASQPAIRPLESLRCSTDNATGRIVVEL